ncbi:hypothetical protein IW138_002483 [Coemansia sp. RSA 986]|nr:hypothetical protein IW138_002483 [Coemansia sp. RSA 986]
MESPNDTPTPNRHSRNFLGPGGLGSQTGQSLLSGGHGSMTDSTPAKPQTKDDVTPAEDEEMNRRRARLLRHFKDDPETLLFDEFLSNIGEQNTYNNFVKSAPTLFHNLAQAAPALTIKKLIVTKGQEQNETAKAFDHTNKSGEDALMAYFITLYEEMSKSAVAAVSPPNMPNVAIPQLRYSLTDHQNKPIPNSSHKADGVFYYTKRIIEDLASLLDYVNAIWTEQPTRTFTPILYVHGEVITLFVFTRGAWYRIELGRICHTNISPNILDVASIRMSLLRLWFIVTLPANRFGHFCDVDIESRCIQFGRPDTSSKLANAILTSSDDLNTFSLKSRISRIVNPRSRLVYLFDTTYKSKRVVLKLSWTPVKRIPESAVYDILHQTGVEGVPEIYDSGLIQANFFGYRLEYIILEYCGQSLGTYVVECRKRGVPDSEIHKNANQFIRQVSNCLVQARARGVLHRDISDGNIAVRNGQAKVIDWGYAKIIESNSSGVIGIDPAVTDKVAQQWGFDKAAVLENEGTWDPLTGTVLFMSIPVLFGLPKRGLFDDIESLFYVVLHAFADSEDCSGFKHYNNESLALTRVGILGCERSCLRLFNVKSGLGALQETISAMLKFLFYLGDS